MAKLNINGTQMDVEADGNMPLLWAVRDIAGMIGTKYGCGVGLCGACTVHIDGVAQRSCMMTVDEAVGKSVTTIEGLHPEGEHRVQQAWRELNVPQ